MAKLRNSFEKSINQFLIEKKINFEYEAEKLPYVLHATYLPDFTIRRVLQATPLRIELKGYLRREDKRKLRAIKAQHPEIDLRILFYNDRRKQDLRWATKHRIPYAISNIPEDWLDDAERKKRTTAVTKVRLPRRCTHPIKK